MQLEVVSLAIIHVPLVNLLMSMFVLLVLQTTITFPAISVYLVLWTVFQHALQVIALIAIMVLVSQLLEIVAHTILDVQIALLLIIALLVYLDIIWRHQILASLVLQTVLVVLEDLAFIVMILMEFLVEHVFLVELAACCAHPMQQYVQAANTIMVWI